MNAQVLLGLAGLGHRVRALAAMTLDDGGPGDVFAQDHPEVVFAHRDATLVLSAPKR